MRTRLFIPAAATLLFALAACTRDEAAEGTLPAGEYPVIIQANGLDVTAAPVSRATVDGDWQGVTSVALRLDGAVKEYTVTASDADGYRSATLSRTADTFYWTSRNDITVSAWWPYAETLPAVKVAEDQSKLADFQNSDFISAENQTVTFSDPKLTFTHRTARVTVVLKPGTGIESVAGATVSLVSLSAEGSNPTAIKTCNTAGDTYEALTAPQTVAAGEPFIRVVLGDGTFYFRPQNDVVLEAGSRYTYTVNVNATGLTLAGCEIDKWDGGGGESGAAEDLGYIYDNTTNSYTVYNADGLLVWNEAAQNDLTIGCTLTADIDLTGKTWTPIDQYGISGYQGVFDGQGHRIAGLAITTDDRYSESVALFGRIGDRGTVKNLQLVDVDFNVIQNGTSGGIATSNYGTITACSVTGTIAVANGNPGGIVSFNSGTITACWFKGTITGPNCSNIVSFNSGTITACYYGWNGYPGVATNYGTADTHIIDSGASWQTAVDGMNATLTGNDYQWNLGADDLPVLVKRQP